MCESRHHPHVRAKAHAHSRAEACCCCGEPAPHHGAECCDSGPIAHPASECCETGLGVGFHRRFTGRGEVIAKLEAYLTELQAEAKAVQEKLTELRRAA